MNKKIDEKHMKLFTIIVAAYILFYFILNPYSLQYYFHNCLGKLLLLLYIINITMVSPLFAVIFSAVILGIYNYMIFNVEGMINMDNKNGTEKKALQNTGKEGYDNIDVNLSPSSYGMERNKIITVEKYIRPKCSNALIIIESTSNKEPSAYFP